MPVSLTPTSVGEVEPRPEGALRQGGLDDGRLERLGDEDAFCRRRRGSVGSPDTYPLMTPIGRTRATFFDSPAS
jgi:hypothetical protein